MPLVSGAFPFRALHGQGWHGKYYLKGGFFFAPTLLALTLACTKSRNYLCIQKSNGPSIGCFKYY